MNAIAQLSIFGLASGAWRKSTTDRQQNALPHALSTHTP